MAHPDFYDENRHRSFPFLEKTTGRPVAGPLQIRHLPDAAIVDCGFVLGPSSGFVASQHEVRLDRITRQGALFRFHFLCTAPGLLDSPLVFERSLGDARYTTTFSDAEVPSGSASLSIPDEACDEPPWWGYLVTGDMDALDAFLSGDGSVSGGPGQGVVEPALLHNLDNSHVVSVHLANDDRTRASAPEGCPPLVWPFAPGTVFVNGRCLDGLLVFKAGFNCTVRHDPASNALLFSASVGAGEGEPCSPVPLYPGETPPPGSSLLEGGVRCNEVLRSINGVGGPSVRFQGGVGVTLTADPLNHRLIVDVNANTSRLCGGTSESWIEMSESL